MAEYISIPEFAKLAGISHQAVYKQLRNKLQPYLQEVEGKKMLSISALHDVYGIGEVQPDAQPVAQQNNHFDILVAALKQQLEAKDQQLKQKDEQIAALHRILEQQNTLALADKQSILQLTNGEPNSENGENSSKKMWFQFWK